MKMSLMLNRIDKQSLKTIAFAVALYNELLFTAMNGYGPFNWCTLPLLIELEN